ncbi:MAG TPA: polysaccharide deacetylase family protein, partial [Cyclobacteriaceae bacterium]|nr:polysaccharide deacetylase family protein [Cyclobacteriaceae bacterium]
LIDESFAKVRNGSFKPFQRTERTPENRITWDEIRNIASRGHEFASHTITHPRLAVLDEANILYELEKSREEINARLGLEHTFSAECPYGTENERVMEYAYKIYPALRNRMPEPYLEELNRGSRMNPVESIKDYVQWQRGPLTDVPMERMKSWVDTIASRSNIWLVLVFHGVDGIGWEPRTGDELREYYSYIKSMDDRLWVATFRDVAKYMRERMESVAEVVEENGRWTIRLSNELDPVIYDLPLTLKTYVPDKITAVTLTQGEKDLAANMAKDERGNFVMYRAIPNGEPVVISFD